MPPTMEEFSRTGARLIKGHLSMVVKTLRAMDPSEDFIKYGLSTEVLRFFFGNKWTNDHVFAIHRDVERHHVNGRNFLRTNEENGRITHLHQQGVLELAEYVFNLQHTEGFRERIARMDRDNFESVFGEFTCAAYLAAPSLKLRFVSPTGRKGQDYEAEVISAQGRVVCCEIKTKSEGTPLTANTLDATLETARKQLPKERPGLVLISLPMTWMRHSNLWQIIECAVAGVFKRSQRIVAVFLTWEESQQISEGCFFGIRSQKYLNQNSHLFGSDIRELLNTMRRNNNRHWIQLHEFVERELQGNSP